MRLCLNLTTMLRADVETGVKAAASAGFEEVELWADPLERYLESHTAEDLRGLLEANEIKVAAIGDIESITFCDEDQFDELRGKCERLAEVAKAISCPTLVASASVRPRDAEEERIAEETVSALGGLLDVVEPLGVSLSLAFRGFAWCAVNTLKGAREAVAAHSARRVGLALDTFDLHATGATPDDLKLIDPALINVFRLSDCEDLPAALLTETGRVLPGEGAAGLDEMLEAVRELGYAGPVSMKIPSPRLFGLDADEAAKVVMAVSQPYLAETSAETTR
jgi:sugar phosphate isomerase/epimerase